MTFKFISIDKCPTPSALRAIFSRLQWWKWPSVTSSHCLIIAHNTMDISCATTMSTNSGRLNHQLPTASSQDMFYLDQRRTELPTPTQKCKAETHQYWSLCCKGCSLDGIFTDKENSLTVFCIPSSCQQESWTQRTHISSIATRSSLEYKNAIKMEAQKPNLHNVTKYNHIWVFRDMSGRHCFHSGLKFWSPTISLNQTCGNKPLKGCLGK
jgi:hypothetical protein